MRPPTARGRGFSGLALLGFSIVGALAQVSNPLPVVPQNTNPPAPRRASIVFMLADDLGYGDLGCYGQQRIKTPNLDRMAAEGMRFTQFYAGSTVCAPSRAALMLGQHTGHLRLRGNRTAGTLEADETTLADLLKQSGYHTGLIGKWGLSDRGLPGEPAKKGFNEFVGYLNNKHAHDYYSDRLWRFDARPRMDGEPGPTYDGEVLFLENQLGKRGRYLPDTFAQAALNFININKPDRLNRRRPFFLLYCPTIPHANNEEGARTGNGMQVPDDAPYGGEPWPQAERNKAAMITRLDADVGRLLDKLQQLQLDEETIVCFTSDNGPHKEGGVDPKFHKSSGPLRGHKRDLTEGGIRVPMIVRWPGKVPAGVVSDQVWAMWDVLPTLAALARTEPPKGLDGISRLPTLLGRPQTNQHDFLYWEFHEGGFHQAVRRQDWKGIRHGVDGELELYDLKKDPGEKEDVAAANPEVVKELTEILAAARTDAPGWPAKKKPAPETAAESPPQPKRQ